MTTSGNREIENEKPTTNYPKTATATGPTKMEGAYDLPVSKLRNRPKRALQHRCKLLPVCFSRGDITAMKMKISQSLLDEINATFSAGTVLNLKITPHSCLSKRVIPRKWYERLWRPSFFVEEHDYSVSLVDDAGREIIDFGTYPGGGSLTVQGLKIELEKGDVAISNPD